VKKSYPRNTDIRNAIIEVLSKDIIEHPDDFPEYVYKKLEDKGFYTGLLTVKRIWKIYEEMVRKKWLDDVLDVVKKK
jgi:Fe2+ or Zn2+ uptake regulation protein